MRTEYIFPTVLIALDVCASVPYAVKCNWRKEDIAAIQNGSAE
jgi:hypothetical protein